MEVGQAIEHFVACGTLQAARASDGIFSLSAEFKDPTVARGNTCWTCNEVIAVTGTLVPTYRPAFSNVRFTWPKNWLPGQLAFHHSGMGSAGGQVSEMPTIQTSEFRAFVGE
jgi:hypothetical protein